LPGTLQWVDSHITLNFGKAIEFFKNLKTIGAGVQLSGLSLNPGQMKQLLHHLDEKYPLGLTMSHQICYLCYQAPDAHFS